MEGSGGGGIPTLRHVPSNVTPLDAPPLQARACLFLETYPRLEETGAGNTPNAASRIQRAARRTAKRASTMRPRPSAIKRVRETANSMPNLLTPVPHGAWAQGVAPWYWDLLRGFGGGGGGGAVMRGRAVNVMGVRSRRARLLPRPQGIA